MRQVTKPHRVVEYTMSLLDELVAENVGTRYLTDQPVSMPLLADLLTGEVSTGGARYREPKRR